MNGYARRNDDRHDNEIPDLEEWMAGDDTLPDPDTGTDVPLVVEDTAHANRVLRRIRYWDRREAELREQVDAEKARLEAFLHDRLHAVQRGRAWAEQGIEGWARAVHAQDPSIKTITLPAGVVRVRPPSKRTVVDDPDVVGERFPDAVKPTIVSVDRTVLGKLTTVGPATGQYDADGFVLHAAIDAAGERVPGMLYAVAPCESVTWKATP